VSDPEITLAPCPFCGSHRVGVALGQAVCHDCDARVHVSGVTTNDAALELWNRRSSPTKEEPLRGGDRENIEAIRGALMAARDRARAGNDINEVDRYLLPLLHFERLYFSIPTKEEMEFTRLSEIAARQTIAFMNGQIADRMSELDAPRENWLAAYRRLVSSRTEPRT